MKKTHPKVMAAIASVEREQAEIIARAKTKADDARRDANRRDYFAAEALSALIAATTAETTPILYRIQRWLFGSIVQSYHASHAEQLCPLAYAFADMMIEAGNAPKLKTEAA